MLERLPLYITWFNLFIVSLNDASHKYLRIIQLMYTQLKHFGKYRTGKSIHLLLFYESLSQPGYE